MINHKKSAFFCCLLAHVGSQALMEEPMQEHRPEPIQTLDADQRQLLKIIESGQNWFAPDGCGNARPCTEADYHRFQATVDQLRLIRNAGYIEMIEHEVTVNGQTFIDRVETVLKY